MKYKGVILGFLSAVLSLAAQAQPFAVLPDMPDMKKGTLPNGTSYYIFRNSSSKGIADFALVQRVGYSDENPGEEGKALAVAKECLSVSGRLGKHSPQQVMVDGGALPPADGFIKVDSISTVFWFDDIPVLDQAARTDSSLLVLFDMIDRNSRSEDPFVREHYQPSEQAVIVSGDIDPAVLESKMQMLSLMTPSVPVAADTAKLPAGHAETSDLVETDAREPGEAQEFPSCGAVPDKLSNGLSSLHVEYRLARTPQEFMGTVYPAITSKYVNKMGIALKRRVRKLMERDSLPCVSLKTSYVGSCMQPGKELFAIDLEVREEDLGKTASTVASALSSMSRQGITMDEGKYTSGVFAEDLLEWAINPIVLNSTNVSRAISAFLYGAPLASPLSEMDYLLSKSISDSLECRLINNFSKAILSDSLNMAVSFTSATLQKEEVDAAFSEGWKAGGDLPDSTWALAALDRTAPAAEKIKLRHNRPEPVTGGRIWMFSNGMKVVYKQMPVGEHMYASLIMNRGFASLKNLAAGEGVLVGDILKLYDIGGIPYGDYMDALLASRVKVDCSVRNFSTSIDISSPADSLPLALDVIRKITGSRTLNPAAAALYARSETLYHKAVRGTRAERIQVIDSIMCPNYSFSPYRRPGCFSQELLERTDAFFNETFSNLKNGIVVIIASAAPDDFRKKLSPMLGGFNTADAFFRLPPVSFQPQAGSATYTVNGDEFSADIAISARIPLTSQNNVLAQVASMIMQEKLIRTLLPAGIDVKVSTSFRKVPQERFNVLISLTSVDENGFVEGYVDRNIVNVLSAVREIIREKPSLEEVEKYLPIAKALLMSRHEHMKTYPGFYIATIKTRYLEGKDLFSKYESDLAAADAANVLRIYEAVSKGSVVEYITDVLYK